ncbi:hypothetical protein HDU79_011968 [Rhizoclosmatium sp. JEL0117]|nr:hypothetical protein HDU79_011968 [Rhizoclosmatium sp. JEL0117]
MVHTTNILKSSLRPKHFTGSTHLDLVHVLAAAYGIGPAPQIPVVLAAIANPGPLPVGANAGARAQWDLIIKDSHVILPTVVLFLTLVLPIRWLEIITLQLVDNGGSTSTASNSMTFGAYEHHMDALYVPGLHELLGSPYTEAVAATFKQQRVYDLHVLEPLVSCVGWGSILLD